MLSGTRSLKATTALLRSVAVRRSAVTAAHHRPRISATRSLAAAAAELAVATPRGLAHCEFRKRPCRFQALGTRKLGAEQLTMHRTIINGGRWRQVVDRGLRFGFDRSRSSFDGCRRRIRRVAHIVGSGGRN